MGSLPVFGQSDFCIEVLDHWAARTLACHKTVQWADDSQCSGKAWFPSSNAAKAQCLADVDARDCEAIDSLPGTCLDLFPP